MKAKGLNFDEIYGKHLKVTDNNGDPSKPGFSLVTPLNGDSWNWRERPEFKDLVKQKLNDPGFLGDHKYQQIIDAMSGKPFDPTKHLKKSKETRDNMKNEEVVTEGKRLDRLKKLGIVAGMSLLGGGVAAARHNQHNTYTDKTGTRIVDGSAVPAGVAGVLGGGLIGSLMARDMVASSERNRALKKHLKKSKETRDNMKNEEVKIDKQRNGRPFPETRFPGWKVGNNMLTQKRATKTKRALTSAQKANGLKNEEYTQVLEQMIISLTGMELEELHEAVSGHLSEDYQTPARNAQMQDMYDRAEGKFMKNISSDKLLRKVWRIDNENNAEQQSPRLYGKNGKIIKQTKKKKRVRVGQPGGRQGGYQGGNQIGNV